MGSFVSRGIAIWGIIGGLILFISPGAGAQTSMQFSLGGVTGTFYIVGAQVAKYVNGNSKMLYITPITSGGTVENLKRLGQGVAQLGMASVDGMYQSWNGSPPFKGKLRDWRVIGTATAPSVPHMVALAKSNLRMLEDLKGKIVDLGAPGSGGTATLQKFLEHIGLLKDMKARYLPHQDGPRLLMDGKLDAMNRSGQPPIAGIMEISVQEKISLVDMGPALERSDFLKVNPYFQRVVIKGGTYRGEDRNITVFGTGTFFVVHKNVPEAAVYEFTRLAYSDECIGLVTHGYKGHNMNRTRPLEGNVGPVHPGAAKFWREMGLKIPEPILQ